MMRIAIAVTLGMIALLGSVSGALAQRDGADRGGGRLDSQELRNDMDQDRLKKPTTPPPWQATPIPSPDEKSRPKSNQTRDRIRQ
jgi:hypothetical protein